MSSEPLLSVREAGKTYERHGWLRRTPPAKRALHDIIFDLDRGQTLAIVGSSGSGKSTLARCIAGFEKLSAGEIRFDGTQRQVQLIPQQPAASLNPRFTAAEIIAEPLVIQKHGTARIREARARELMETVGLPATAAGKRALEFSGGERQRLAIARALAVEPKLLILDESLTGFDWALQAQITALLADLQARFGIAYILISHDLEAAARMASEIAVMEDGTIVERAPARQLLESPRHARSRELRDAALALALGDSL
ncbi:MAG TPA: ATP-binding cassette domain-containing protein [Bryobacteraceae bacterium]|jgi:ABC-type glutathione transport system ATPase component